MLLFVLFALLGWGARAGRVEDLLQQGSLMLASQNLQAATEAFRMVYEGLKGFNRKMRIVTVSESSLKSYYSNRVPIAKYRKFDTSQARDLDPQSAAAWFNLGVIETADPKSFGTAVAFMRKVEPSKVFDLRSVAPLIT